MLLPLPPMASKSRMLVSVRWLRPIAESLKFLGAANEFVATYVVGLGVEGGGIGMVS